MTDFDVVIIGAGIAGISTAYYLATKHNITNVLIVDKRPPMTFTSDKSGSNYRNWWSHPAMVKLANHSIDKMDELANKTHNIFNMNRRGYAYFSRNADVEPYLKRYSQDEVGEIRIYRGDAKTYQPEENPELAGADVLVGNDIIKQYAPFVEEDIQAMVHVRRAGWLSTRVMAHHMLDTASGLGVAELRGEVVAFGDGNGKRWELSVNTPYGQQFITTHKLLKTVGPNGVSGWATGVTNLPISNVFHQKVMMRDNGKILPDGMPFMIFTDSPTCDWTGEERNYLVEHVGSDKIPGNFHIRRVNNEWIHLGWAFNNKTTDDVDAVQFEPLFPKVVLKGMSSFIPELKSYIETFPVPSQYGGEYFVNPSRKLDTDNITLPIIVSGGFYTRTHENLPIIHSARPGHYAITALSGFGVMMGCGIGDIMSDMIAGKDVPEYVKAFSADRYKDPDYMEQITKFDSGEL